jgi:hypothetical protein
MMKASDTIYREAVASVARGPKAQQFIQRRAEPWNELTATNICSSAQRANRFSSGERTAGPLALRTMFSSRNYQGSALRWVNRRPFGARSRGTALILVLVALAVTTLLFMAAMKMIVVQRKTIEVNARQIQAGWLADSGIRRAAARLAAEADYRGETWNISAEDLGGRDGGIVTIKVEQVPGKADRRAVHVEADYPPELEQRARETRDVTIGIGHQP